MAFNAESSPAQGKWRKTTERGTERFVAKHIATEKAMAGLRHEVVYSNVMRRTKKRIAQSKRARVGSLVIVDQPQLVQTCILQPSFV
ncbi:unnamed protein product [Ascophyllum nodosum]